MYRDNFFCLESKKKNKARIVFASQCLRFLSSLFLKSNQTYSTSVCNHNDPIDSKRAAEHAVRASLDLESQHPNSKI